jgi:hypothetical protein
VAIPVVAEAAQAVVVGHILVAAGIQAEAERISAVVGRISPHGQRRTSLGGLAVAAVHVCHAPLHLFVRQVTARRRIPLRLVA